MTGVQRRKSHSHGLRELTTSILSHIMLNSNENWCSISCSLWVIEEALDGMQQNKTKYPTLLWTAVCFLRLFLQINELACLYSWKFYLHWKQYLDSRSKSWKTQCRMWSDHHVIRNEKKCFIQFIIQVTEGLIVDGSFQNRKSDWWRRISVHSQWRQWRWRANSLGRQAPLKFTSLTICCCITKF